MTSISSLEALAGRRFPGGCDDCNAYQTVRRCPNDAWGEVYVLTVHHDDTCPYLNQESR